MSGNISKNKSPQTFKTTLKKLKSWTVAPLPSTFEIEAVHPFGRTPIKAIFEGCSWDTSIWTASSGESMIALPKKIRGSFEVGDEVEISFVYDYDRF